MKISETRNGETLVKVTGRDFDLYSHQEEAIKLVDAGKNVILSVPTASGKTVVAYHALIRSAINGMRAMYVAPLRALASEKYRELRPLRESGIRVGMSIGDLEVDMEKMRKMRILICTSERADSILRHDPDFIREFGVIVTDETHILGDPGRGPILEMFLNSARMINPDIQVVSLSATLSNHAEIGKWLGAQTVISDFRPVPIKYAIINRGKLIYDDDDAEQLGGNGIVPLIRKHCDEGGQVLIFRGSRRKSEETALELSESLDFNSDVVSRSDSEESDPHEEILDSMMKRGIAFHHAGLSSDRRERIESGFMSGKIKVITATPTLASGVNLPARVVIVRDITRFNGGYSEYLPVSEVRQMLGRAGRPAYDKIGYGVIYAATESSPQAARKYFESEPEPIISGLGEPAKVRFCVLGLVSMGLVNSRKSLPEFFGTTLYSMQNDPEEIISTAESALEFLVDNDFVRVRGDTYTATKFGAAASNLYIDPLTALTIREYLESGEYDEERALLSASTTPDMPRSYAGRDEGISYERFLYDNGYEEVSEDLMGAAKTAMILRDWISEKSIRDISEKYNVGHGDIQARSRAGEWIVFSMSRLASILRPEIAGELDLLSLRIKEGVGREVLGLTVLRGIGRVRARRLFKAGLRDIDSIASSDIEVLNAIPGFSSRLSGDIIAQARKLRGKRE